MCMVRRMAYREECAEQDQVRHIEEWTSGVKVEKIEDDTVVLSLDRSKIKKILTEDKDIRLFAYDFCCK